MMCFLSMHMSLLQDGEGSGDEHISEEDSSDDEIDLIIYILKKREMDRRRACMLAAMIGTYYLELYSNKAPRRGAPESGHDWVMRTLANRTACYNMFRMHRPVFERLHSVLVESYELKSTNNMDSLECLGLFLWIVGAPQLVRQAQDRFVRSLNTVHSKFKAVLTALLKLAQDIIRPKDPLFTTVHKKLLSPQYTPYLDNCIGAIDGTHIQVVVPNSAAVQHRNRHKEKSQNVMCVCDFDMRFTFVLAGWPGSVHDMRVFNDAQTRFSAKFPKPPPGKFYLVDSGYPNRPGYLAPYKGITYHFQEYNESTLPRGRREHFNYCHSSCRNVIERSFGVLKNKWRILFSLPSYSQEKQSRIIHACIALHYFIRDSQMADTEFDNCDHDENYDPLGGTSSPSSEPTNELDSRVMNQFRDWIADGLWYLKGM
nr:uncharacterized protein LOC107277889 isoform X1 [Oryza sativa Japonica Group]XP_025877425.1 uncharacterized protein LOC107277889 isoform X1 [Oryza sativa Japonica Group]